MLKRLMMCVLAGLMIMLVGCNSNTVKEVTQDEMITNTSFPAGNTLEQSQEKKESEVESSKAQEETKIESEAKPTENQVNTAVKPKTENSTSSTSPKQQEEKRQTSPKKHTTEPQKTTVYSTQKTTTTKKVTTTQKQTTTKPKTTEAPYFCDEGGTHHSCEVGPIGWVDSYDDAQGKALEYIANHNTSGNFRVKECFYCGKFTASVILR